MASMSEGDAPFVVRGLRRNGSVTYRCPDAVWALRKWNDFVRSGYAEISATGPDGRALDDEALRLMIARSRAVEPVEG